MSMALKYLSEFVEIIILFVVFQIHQLPLQAIHEHMILDKIFNDEMGEWSLFTCYIWNKKNQSRKHNQRNGQHVDIEDFIWYEW